MRKSLSIILVGLSVYANARQISPNEAEAIASDFLNTTTINLASSKRIGINRVKEANENESFQPYYIFNGNEGNGFVIVAGDDCVKQILGYSFESSFNYNNISPALAWLLEEYKKEICNLSERSTSFERDDNSPIKPALKPLLTSQWGQEQPFNDLCPEYEGLRLPTGCVATAVAQVLNYHQWPDKGEGSFSYQWADKSLTFDYDDTSFDWNLMINKYDYATPKEACEEVATLMFACGVGLEMYYTLSGSGSDISRAKRFLVENMKYDSEAKIVWRHNYSYSEWTETIYDELIAGRPVILSGGDHAFVCDGYDGNEYFHFNWGWNGDMDGYFIFNDLSPLGYSFSSNLHALVNLHSRKGEVSPLSYDIYSSGSFKFVNDTFIIENITNYSRYDYRGSIGVETIEKTSGKRFFYELADFSIEGSMPFGPGVFFTTQNFEIYNTNISLPTGYYELYPAYSSFNGSYTRIPCLAGGQSFISLVVDKNGKYTYSNPGNETSSHLEVFDICFIGEDVSPTEFYITGDNSFNLTYNILNHSEYAVGDPSVIITNATGDEILQHTGGSLILEPDSENPLALNFVSVLLRPGEHTVKFLDSDGNIIGVPYEFTVIGNQPEVKVEEIENLYIESNNNETTYAMALNMLPNSLVNLKGSIELFREDNSICCKDLPFYLSDQQGVLIVYFKQPFDKPLFGDYKVNVFDNYGVKLNDTPLNLSINIPAYTLHIELPRDYNGYMGIADSMQLHCLMSDTDYSYTCPIEWSSSNAQIASVLQSGVVEALSEGEVTITVTALDGTGHSASVDIIVKSIPSESILLTTESLTGIIGESFSIEATVFPANATDKTITWISSDESVAVVDDNGEVTVVGVGNVVITAACGEITSECALKCYPRIGDANWNGSITVADAVDISNYVVKKKTAPEEWDEDEWMEFYSVGANANESEDGSITFADASAAVRIALSQPEAASEPNRIRSPFGNANESSDALVVGALRETNDGKTYVTVKLHNSIEYVALQADIFIPDGIDVEVKAGSRAASHSLETMRFDSNHLRVAIFNLGNKALAAGDDPVLEIVADCDMSGIEGLTISNILAADSEANEYVLGSRMGDVTGVEGVSCDAVLIEKISGGLQISNAAGKRIDICTMDGKTVKSFVANDSIEIINLPAGIYIVKAGDKNLKVIL